MTAFKLCKRYKIVLEYLGVGFCGWQKQRGVKSVQEEVEKVLSSVLKEEIKLTVAGRTDCGVNATGQVAHFDSKAEPLNLFSVLCAANYHLCPNPVAILSIEPVDCSFNARLSAKKRHYQYKILNRKAPIIIKKGLYWQVFTKLDTEKMKQQAEHFIGCHNFTSFRCAKCQAKTPIRTLDKMEIVENDQEIFINVSAQSFLHNQVRIIVGTLVEIGRGKDMDIGKIIAMENRKYAGPTAPAFGLYLVGVDY